MFHKKRTWSISQIQTAQELASELTRYSSFVLCTGYQLNNFLFLNDSTSEDGAAEFVVLAIVEGTYLEVESITFGWCSKEEALGYIESLLDGNYYNPRQVTPLLDYSDTHTCHLCA